MPLPLFPHDRCIKLIALHRIHNHVRTALWLLISGDWLAFFSHDRPTRRPIDGLQVNHTTIGLLVLEMQEPVFTIFSMYPTALMRPVDVCLALCQYDLVLIWTVGRLGTHGELETCWHAPSRTHDPVPAVTLIELRTFTGTVFRTVAIEDNHWLSNSTRAVSRQFPDRQHTGIFRA